jgi:hypothetical protein
MPTAGGLPGRRAARLVPGEIAGYGVIALALAALLWRHVRQVDGFFLDEWFYVHGAQYIWENLPGALVGTIPEWNRGPQRLYSTLLATTWGPLAPSTAYTLSHVLNVVLLVSTLVPTALLARRVIDHALLRVLAVALGIAVPWLTIGSHLLTENLAFPLYVWAVYAIVRAAEQPSPARQAVALAVIAALGLCRLNLAFVMGVFFLAVVAGEVHRRRTERGEPLGGWLRRALRRQALVVGAGVAVAAAAGVLALRGTSGLGAYGGFDFATVIERLFGDRAADTRQTMLDYTRSLVVGGFVLPFAIGLGVALAGATGRLGRRLVIPALVALAGAAVVVVAVSVYTVGSAFEERYVFYVYTPIAVLAVAGLEQAHRIRWWLVAASALTLWPLSEGSARPALDSGHFFAAPAGAFWARVVDHRLAGWWEDLFGWSSIDPRGWLLVAAGLSAMLMFVVVAARSRPRLAAALLATGLALCAAAQVAALDYDFKQELYGTTEAPGGIALSEGSAIDRETWLDDRLPAGKWAAVVPGVPSFGAPLGGTEKLSFWNRALDATVVLSWNEAPSPAPPGYGLVGTRLGRDGLVRWSPRPDWVAAQRDDPRVQFPGRIVARSSLSPYALYRTARWDRAVWTSVGLEPDGVLLAGRPVTMRIDRRSAPGARVVAVTLQAADGATEPVRWRLTRAGRPVATGRLRPGRTRRVQVPVPVCEAAQACPPVAWKLRGSGPAVGLPLPGYGAPGALRSVLLKVAAARLGAR